MRNYFKLVFLDHGPVAGTRSYTLYWTISHEGKKTYSEQRYNSELWKSDVALVENHGGVILSIASLIGKTA